MWIKDFIRSKTKLKLYVLTMLFSEPAKKLPKGYRHSDSEDSESESESEEEEPRGRGRPKASSKKSTAKKGRGRPKGGSKKVELPKGYASYDSEDFDFTSSDEELPEPKLSRSGRPIKPVFQSELLILINFIILLKNRSQG